MIKQFGACEFPGRRRICRLPAAKHQHGNTGGPTSGRWRRMMQRAEAALRPQD